MVAWQDPKEVRSACAIGSSFAMPASCMDPHGIMASSVWDTTSHSAPSATNKQPSPAQPVPVAKAPAATMPRLMGCGLQSNRPHWMAVRDAQNTPAIPPASLGTPCVPQPGAVKYLYVKPKLADAAACGDAHSQCITVWLEHGV